MTSIAFSLKLICFSFSSAWLHGIILKKSNTEKTKRTSLNPFSLAIFKDRL